MLLSRSSARPRFPSLVGHSFGLRIKTRIGQRLILIESQTYVVYGFFVQFHKNPRLDPLIDRIHAHIAITDLSLLLERVIEHAAEDTWRNIRDDLKQIQLAQLLSPTRTLWQVTYPKPKADKS